MRLAADVAWVCVWESVCVGGDLCMTCLCCLHSAGLFFFDSSDMCRSFWPRSSLPNMIIHGVYRDSGNTDGQGGGQGRRGEGGGKESRKWRWRGRREYYYYDTHLAVWLEKRWNAGLRDKGWKTSRKTTRGDRMEEMLCTGRKEWGYQDLGSCFELWDTILRFLTAASKYQQYSIACVNCVVHRWCMLSLKHTTLCWHWLKTAVSDMSPAFGQQQYLQVFITRKNS